MTGVERRPRRVAIVGGGLAGTVCATMLATTSDSVDVVIFDMGSRGVGGRASHREGAQRRFSHGCQFFPCGDDAAPEWRAMVDAWLRQGLIVDWTDHARVGWVDASSGKFSELGVDPLPPTCTDGGFFGALKPGVRLYVPRGGMRTLCLGLVNDAPADRLVVRAQCRVRAVSRSGSTWWLHGNTGDAAHHEVAEAEAEAAGNGALLDPDGRPQMRLRRSALACFVDGAPPSPLPMPKGGGREREKSELLLAANKGSPPKRGT